MIGRCGIWLACAIALGQAASAAEPRPFLRGYKPPQMADAENHPQVRFLSEKLMTDRDRQRKDPRPEPVFRIDEKTGRLAGTPRSAGACPFIVTAIVRDGPQVLLDARRVVITIQE